MFEAGKSERSTVDSFMKFRALKEKERKTFFTKKSQESKKDKKTVKVSFVCHNRDEDYCNFHFIITLKDS